MKKHGFTLVEIMLVMVVIGLLASITIPSLTKIRAVTRKNFCKDAQCMISGAIDQWTIKSGAAQGSPITPGDPNILAYIKGGSFPKCHDGNVAFVFPAKVGDAVTCPIGIASHNQP